MLFVQGPIRYCAIMLAMRWKRLFYYLLLNVIVTACTMFAVLYAWERYRPQVADGPLEMLFPTRPSATALPAAETSEGEIPSEQMGFEQYTVQPGDSLTGIAEEYGTTIEEILAFNDLEDPDALTVGMVLNIPVPGGTGPAPTEVLPEPSRTPLPAPTLAVTGSPTRSGAPSLQISLVIGAGDIEEERVIIRQTGEAQVSLQGWQLIAPAGEVYTFPQLVLFKDGAVTVFTKAGANSVAELHWGLDRPVWSPGDVVSLRDPAGNIVAAYQVP